MVGLGQRVKSH